jgi:hypothetical protein
VEAYQTANAHDQHVMSVGADGLIPGDCKAGELPERTPALPDVRPHAPVDLATLARVRDNLRSLRWSPDNPFAGRSVIDLEAWRVQRERQAAR